MPTLVRTREEIRGTNAMLERLLARPMVRISRRKCKGTGRHETRIDTLLRRWVLRNTPETFSDSQGPLAPLLGQVASPSRSLTSHRLLVKWILEDPGTPRCIRDAKSPGMEESTTRSGSLSLSTKTTG